MDYKRHSPEISACLNYADTCPISYCRHELFAMVKENQKGKLNYSHQKKGKQPNNVFKSKLKYHENYILSNYKPTPTKNLNLNKLKFKSKCKTTLSTSPSLVSSAPSISSNQLNLKSHSDTSGNKNCSSLFPSRKLKPIINTCYISKNKPPLRSQIPPARLRSVSKEFRNNEKSNSFCLTSDSFSGLENNNKNRLSESSSLVKGTCHSRKYSCNINAIIKASISMAGRVSSNLMENQTENQTEILPEILSEKLTENQTGKKKEGKENGKEREIKNENELKTNYIPESSLNHSESFFFSNDTKNINNINNVSNYNISINNKSANIIQDNNLICRYDNNNNKNNNEQKTNVLIDIGKNSNISHCCSSHHQQQQRSNIKSMKVCLSCHTNESPCWRPSWKPKDGQLCNSCGLRFKKTRACCSNPLCRRIPAKGEWAYIKHKSGNSDSFCCLECNSTLMLYDKEKSADKNKCRCTKASKHQEIKHSKDHPLYNLTVLLPSPPLSDHS